MSSRKRPAPPNESTPQPDNFRVPSQERAPIYIQNADGTEDVNPEAYRQFGFGWVGANDPTRAEWRRFVRRGIDYTNTPDPMVIINQMFPNWADEGFSIPPRSRANSKEYPSYPSTRSNSPDNQQSQSLSSSSSWSKQSSESVPSPKESDSSTCSCGNNSTAFDETLRHYSKSDCCEHDPKQE